MKNVVDYIFHVLLKNNFKIQYVVNQCYVTIIFFFDFELNIRRYIFVIPSNTGQILIALNILVLIELNLI